MKILNLNQKEGYIKLQIETLDDLWYLSNLINKGDLIKKKDFRKENLSNSNEKSKIIKKLLWITICVEKIELKPESLYVNGKIIEVNDDIKGNYHSFDIKPNDIIEIKNKIITNFEKKLLNYAKSSKFNSFLIVLIDKDNALFFEMTGRNIRKIKEINSNVKKYYSENKIKSQSIDDFFNIIFDEINKIKIKNIIIGTLNIWYNSLNNLKDKLKDKPIVLLKINNIRNGINEILRNKEIKNIMKNNIVYREKTIVDEIKKRISNNTKIAYSNEVYDYIYAIDKLIVSIDYIKKLKENKTYNNLLDVFQQLTSQNSDIIIIAYDQEARATLNSLGGIVGFLRYNVN